MGESIDYKNLTMVEYPYCGLGYRTPKDGRRVDMVSADSALVNGLKEGDFVTHIRDRGQSKWREIKHHTDTHGPPGTAVEVKVFRPSTDETFVLQGFRKKFMYTRDLENGGFYLIQSDQYVVKGCEMHLSQKDSPADLCTLSAQADLPNLANRKGLALT